MLKKAARALEKWGHYLLALLCVAAILLSALWTNQQRAREEPDAQALSDASQRLGQAAPTPVPRWARPAAGEIIRGYSQEPLYFSQYGVWRIHQGVDFAAQEGEAVFALADGQVIEGTPGLWIAHGEGVQSVYQGLAQVNVRPGQQVRAGEQIGVAGGEVLFEGAGHICVTLLRQGIPLDFAAAGFADAETEE